MRTFVDNEAASPATAAQSPGISPESADPARLALSNFQANLAALALAQPQIAAILAQTDDALANFTWLFGRDGSLTARDSLGRWCGGTSIPIRAGRALFATLDLKGAVGCLLAPTSAGQIRAVLNKIAREQAIIALLPCATTARFALHCADFSPDIHAARLWLTAGPQWGEQISHLLEQNPGLCVPHQYVRSAISDEESSAPLISAANPLIAAETARRSAAIAEIHHARAAVPSPLEKITVVAPSKFNLEDLAGPALAHALCNATARSADSRAADYSAAPGAANPNWPRLDPTLPASASPLALALAARHCRAIVAADLYRADLPGIIPDRLPWITWATKDRIAAPAAPRDGLILTCERSRQSALAAGWPADRIKLSQWPSLGSPTLAAAAPIPALGPLTLIADAPLTPIPDQLKEFSSHGVLWEYIAGELAQNPLAVANDIDAYLSSRITRLGIDAQALDRELFRTRLILPAWRRGVARLLLKAQLPVALYGAGWDADEEFRFAWRGPITDLPALRAAASAARAIVDPSPAPTNPAAAAFGRPVVRPQTALSHRATPTAAPSHPPLSPQTVLSLL